MGKTDVLAECVQKLLWRLRNNLSASVFGLPYLGVPPIPSPVPLPEPKEPFLALPAT